MRFLLLLPWSFVLLLADCNWQIPTDSDVKECTQDIQWKAHDEKQATATCREYFATTFVEGIIDPSDNTKVKCTVSRQFECNHITHMDSSLNPVVMFDKCYTFSNKEVSIKEYLANPSASCKAGGGIPVFFTMTQAKHIAEKAHREDIFKIWVNIDRNGKTIEASPANDFPKDFLLYKEPWKTHEETYWAGETLTKTPKEIVDAKEGKKEVFKAPAGVDYMFFRTRTDYVHNLYQGSFERADKDVKASIVCEYKAKVVPNQEKYCEKMQKLTLNAFYDESRGRKRCVYTSLSKYSLAGTKDAIKDFPGCREKPSEDHSTGLDDGTAERKENGNSAYHKLTQSGAHRVAVIKMVTSTGSSESDKAYAANVRSHCYTGATSNEVRLKQRQPYKTYDNFLKEGYTNLMTSPWGSEYPKDECTDFPATMESNALAINKGQIIDVPVPVRFPAICSIASNVDCEQQNYCKRADQFCNNLDSWNTGTGYYLRCECHKFHKDDGGVCKWTESDTSCGKVRRFSTDDWNNVPMGSHSNLAGDFGDAVDRVIVRNGCRMTVWAHPINDWTKPNVILLKDLTVGDHIVPNHLAGTLNGWDSGMSASSVECTCPEPHPHV